MAKSRSLSWRLGVSTLVVVLPLAAFALIMVGWIAHSEREAERKMLVGDAYSLRGQRSGAKSMPISCCQRRSRIRGSFSTAI